MNRNRNDKDDVNEFRLMKLIQLLIRRPDDQDEFGATSDLR